MDFIRFARPAIVGTFAHHVCDDSVNWSHVRFAPRCRRRRFGCCRHDAHTRLHTYSLLLVRRRHLAADLEIRREVHRLHDGDERLQFVVLHDVRGLSMERFQDALAIVDSDVAEHVLGAERIGFKNAS